MQKQPQAGKHNCKYPSKPVRQEALLEPLEGAHLALLKLVKYGAQRHSPLDHRCADVLHERQLDPPTLRNCLSFLECWVLSLGAHCFFIIEDFVLIFVQIFAKHF